MRTKHLFTALMLPAVFAACTQDDLVDVNNNKMQTERISVGEISIVAGNDADSRWAAESEDAFNSVLVEAGDELGAVLVDQMAATPLKPADMHASYTALDHKALYELTDNVNTNYGFEQSGNSWTSYAKMVEGNYLFYFPFQADHNNREALTSILPNVQDLNVTNNVVDKLSAINGVFDGGKTIMGMAYKFIDRADGANVSATFRPLYAYPLVSLVNAYKVYNNTTQAWEYPNLVVKQIALVHNGTGFATKHTVNAAGAATTSALTTQSGAVKAFTEAYSYTNTSSTTTNVAAGNFIEVSGEKYDAQTSEVLSAVNGEVSKAIVLKPSTDITLAYGQKTEFHVVIPAEAYGSTDLTLQILTNKGTFVKTLANPAIAAGRRYPLSEYLDNGTVIAPTLDPDGSLIEVGKGSEYQVAMATPATASVIVSSTSDLVAQLRNVASTVGVTSLDVTPLTKDVCFDEAVAAAFKANVNANFILNINGDITLTAGMTSGTVDTKTINVNGKAYVNGTSVSLTEDWTISNGVEVTGGTLNIATVPTITGGLTIKSGATVNVAAGLAPTFDFANAGTLNTYSAVSLASNTGIVTIGANATQSAPKTLTWGGKFVGSTNGTINVSQYCTVNLTTATATNAGTINNYGTINNVLVNNKTINNYGTLTNVENNSYIYLENVNAQVTNITNGGTKGHIKNNIDVVTEIDANTLANQYVYYEFANQTINGGLYPQAGKVNTIRLTNSTWSPSATQDLATYKMELSGATISVYTPGVVVTLGDIHVFATSTIKGSAEATVNGGTVTNAEGQSLKVINVDSNL